MVQKEVENKENSIRHLTEKKEENPTLLHTYISYGKLDKQILRFLFENKDLRFNIKEFSRINGIARSNIYDSLNRLERNELIKRELGNNQITEKGKIYFEALNKGVGAVRQECRTSSNLSTHFHKFKFVITDKSKFTTERLRYIKNKGIKENKLANLHQVIVNLEDGTLIINPKQVILNLFDVLTEDVEESDIKCLSRALDYAEILRGLKIYTEGVILEEGHWARIESNLSDWLYEKIDKKYFLNLKDGSKFWIDHSLGKNEDETNNKLVRQRVDNFLNQVTSNDFDLKDIDKIKESLGFITKLEASRLKNDIEENTRLKKPKLNFEYNGYIG